MEVVEPALDAVWDRCAPPSKMIDLGIDSVLGASTMSASASLRV